MPSTLIIFRTKKVEKSSPQETIIFRTKNTEKSRLGLIGKNFGKNLRENVSGEEKAPNLVERGQGVLKYERIVWAKIVELFGIARGQFFHFVFVPQSLVDVLLGVVFMSCPHSVLESVEFAEGDSFLCSPDANHHIECFDIVGSVVLWVVYLFHSPYQIYWCKDRKTLRISQWGGMRKKLKNVNFTILFQQYGTAKIAIIYGKASPPTIVSLGEGQSIQVYTK